MHKLITTTVLLLLIANSQAQLTVQSGSTITLSGSTTISLKDIDLQNNGTISQGSGMGKFLFAGTANNTIGGGSTTSFDTLEIAKAGSSKVSLLKTVSINSCVKFTSGIIDLNNNNILLQPAALLSGENELSRITGTTGGYTQITVPLNAPASANPGNLGAVISSAQNLGNTIIRRGHTLQTNGMAAGNSIYRYYDIMPSNNTALNATLRLYYFDTELNGLTENTLVLWKSPDNSNWTNLGYTSRDAVTNYVEKTSINDFSRWTLSSANNPLPLVLTFFTASCNNGNALLTWKTAQEQNTHHFIAQKSKDGIGWQAFATIAAAGNSTTERSYSTTDNAPFAGGTFYRVAAYDVDGRCYYTAIEKSQCGSGNEPISIYPNPVTEQFTINLAATAASALFIKITDAKGSLVYQQQAALQTGSNQVKVNVQSLPSASYYLYLEWNNGQGKNASKFIKQ